MVISLAKIGLISLEIAFAEYRSIHLRYGRNAACSFSEVVFVALDVILFLVGSCCLVQSALELVRQERLH